MNDTRQRGTRELPPSKYFEDFVIGDQYIIPSRTQTSGLFAMFQAASGDNDPIHYDVEYCRQRGHDDLLAHGLQVMIQTAAGAGRFPSEVADSLIGMIEATGKFLRPVYRGNTLYPLLEITDLKEQSNTGVITMRATIHNQEDTLVFEGTQRYLIRKRPI
ncbi:MAG: MaoC family dehydratase [Arenicellales bacterium]|jgi:acyl dehydratase|uniref:MaoC-like domain-containing protein n=1 Tax=marine metagenome TaxID=408172 RepID=A0A381ZHQ4_9ZZZZ|nr:dehydratase [Acidiferrobacteraceae bacterium]MDP6138415.1 MaoC family dehydratase [Arenicellales bacterium]HCF73770.1 dehydratase [Gammaproteobacteria bacterium]MDP6392702.1 MaoC family dehydratase [Arenicellales bacterium]MDP7221164.1 MaoC family dehydratase [Arenicellales bacterium]|tara:strand:- start:21093 stop:21572 length:480 start_codon:yes stop_codon:yes gene_type:complete